MDFSYTSEQEAFRLRLRDWLKQNSAEVFGPHYEKLPKSVAGVFDVGDDDSWGRLLEWHRRLYEAGYIALGWPREWGGAGAGPVEQAHSSNSRPMAKRLMEGSLPTAYTMMRPGGMNKAQSCGTARSCAQGPAPFIGTFGRSGETTWRAFMMLSGWGMPSWMCWRRSTTLSS